MIRATDIHSLTDFTRNAKAYIQQIKTSKSPMALTVNGAAQVVVQDAESFQQMVDELDHSRLLAAIREGQAAREAGEVQDLEEAFAHVRRELDL
jgi:PHD/YefM family antitoxin component YafN of YafNO toxin-antitoxin module